MTIGDYIRNQRMKKALELIETGTYSILQTALFVGYSNLNHFSAAFKKFYGHLPSYYVPRYGELKNNFAAGEKSKSPPKRALF